MHALEAYVGRQSPDCAALAEDVLRDHGYDVSLPSDRPSWRHATERDVALCMEIASPVDEPQDMDVALMRLKGARRLHGAHVGIVGRVGRRVWILHAMQGTGAVFERLASLSAKRYEVAGYYRLKSCSTA